MKLIANILFLLTLTNWTFSQKDTTKYDKSIGELSLEELLNIEVVTASKKIELQSEAPAILSIVTSAEIKNYGAASLIDVLKYIPSLEVSMGSDGAYRVALFGSRKDGNILLLINGQHANDFYSGAAVYDLSVDFIEKIEVIRGPGSALYGTNALSGVINVITVEKSSFSISGGPFGNLNANANLYAEKGNTEFALSAGYVQNNTNSQSIEEDKVHTLPWSLTNQDKTFQTDRWNKDLYLSTNIEQGNLHFQLFNLYRNRGTYVGPTFIASPDSKYESNQLLSSIFYNYKVGENVIITPKFYYQSNYKNSFQQEAPKGYESVISNDLFTDGKNTKENYLGTTYGGEVSIYIKANEHFDFMTGSVYEDITMNRYDLSRNYQIEGEIYKEKFGNYDSLPFDQLGKKRKVFAYYVQTNYKYEKLNLSLGLRYDDYSDFGQSLNPRLGLNYNISSKFRLKALAGRAFRAPAFLEFYDNTTLGNEYGIKGNEKLSNETIETYEIGSEFNTKSMIFKYNIFHIRNKNLIRIYDPHGGGGIGVYENIGNTSIFGHEAELILKFGKLISFNLNFSHFLNKFQWNEETAKDADFQFFQKQAYYNKELRNMPTIRINSGLTFSIAKFNLFLGANFGNGSQNNKRFFLEKDHYVEIPYYLLGNFNASYRLNKKLTISASANNVGRKFSDPDESTNIDAFGELGLIQPSAMYLLKINYNF